VKHIENNKTDRKF